LGIADLEMQLWALAGLTVIIWACESIFEYAFAQAWRNLAQTLQHDLRLDAYDHVQDLEMAYYEDQSTGGLLAILNDDVNQLERFLDSGANDILQLVTTISVIGGIFLYIAPDVAWPAMLPMPFIVWGSLRFQRRLEPRYARVREQVSILSGLLANNLSGIVTIKSFTRENYETERVEAESQAYALANREAIRLSSAFTPIIRMVIVMGFLAMLVLGGRKALAGDLDVGAYSVMVFMIQRLLWPLTRLGQTLDLYQRAMASTNRVMDLLDTKVGIVGGARSLPLAAVQGDIRFEDVSFAYADGRPILKGLSLEMPAGETVAIVGATGSGKSTLIKLLLRFYDPTKGSVTLDGVDLRELNLADLRGAIGLVSQDVYLFHGSVRENIAYGRPDATEAEIIEAAKIAEAHDFIMELTDGYDTIVGERGQKLSGGQRQRVSIARAILKDPPVLVLDEATSSVDNETEAAIQRSLDRIAVDRTTIVIAHRLSTVRGAHRTYVLEEGELREAGTHDELVEGDGIYAGLWRVQTGERVAAD
jgi:ATP-binding cassette subfamily B protein